MLSYKNGQIKKKYDLDFYNVNYYQNSSRKKKQQQSVYRRSKSFTTVLQSLQDIERPQSFLQPRTKVNKLSFIHKSSQQKDEIMRKYREKLTKRTIETEKVTIKSILSPPISHQKAQALIQKLPENCFKQIQQVKKQNLPLKKSIDYLKDQKSKIDIILQSKKQSDQTKLTYLQVKNNQINQQISQQINQMYNRYFKTQYENVYGKRFAFVQFQKSIKSLVQKVQNKHFFN